MLATGGCLLEVDELVVADESPAATAVLSEDPHTVLVEFSSVVADTQEYIIEVGMCAGVLQDGGSSRAKVGGLLWTNSRFHRPPRTTRRLVRRLSCWRARHLKWTATS